MYGRKRLGIFEEQLLNRLPNPLGDLLEVWFGEEYGLGHWLCTLIGDIATFLSISDFDKNVTGLRQ